MSDHGFHVESRAQRPASAGVTVNETHSDVSVATVTTRPNSRKNSPTDPGKNEIGRKTTTSTKVITIAATPISLRPRTAASIGGSPREKGRSAFSRVKIEAANKNPVVSAHARND